MAAHKFVIRLNGAGRGTVEMDGEPLSGVCAVKVEGAVGEAALVTLTFWASEVEVEAEDAAVEAV